MAEHFTKVGEIRDAVLHARLDEIKEAAQWLHDHDAPEGAPETWNTWLSDLRAASETALAAQDLPAAALAVGQMGAACGACHKALNAVPTFASGDAPAATGGVVEHMAVHHWAAERLWEGLVGPSDEAWQKGLAALQVAPLDTAPLLKEGVVADEIKAWEDGIHGKVGADLPDDGEVYGTLLASCAGCHGQTRVADQVEDLPHVQGAGPKVPKG